MPNEQQVKVTQRGSEKTAQKLGKVDRAIGGISKSTLGYTVVAAAALKLIKSSITAYGVQEDAEKRLSTAIGHRSQALLDSASALQKQTRFGDEAIIGVQGSIAAFVKDTEQIRLATEATLDFAAATKMDLKGAGDLIAKTLGSSTNALARYGIEVNGAVGSTERLESLTKNISGLFGGQAAAASTTMAGKMEQAKNSVGDTAEAIGGLLAPAVTGIAQGFGWAAENITAFIDSMGEGLHIEERFAELALDEQIGRLTLSLESQLRQLNQVTEGSKLYNLTQEAVIETTNKLTIATRKKQEAITAAAEAEWLAGQVAGEVRAGSEKNIELLKVGAIPTYKEMTLAQNDLGVTSAEYANFMLQTYAPGVGDALQQTGALLAQTAGDNKDQLIRGMRLSQLAATASTAAGAAKAYEQGGVLGFIGAAAIIATGLTQVASIEQAIGQARSAATGIDTIAFRPTQMVVGDDPGRRGEHIKVTPLGKTGGQSSGGGDTFVFNGNITDKAYVNDFLIPEFKRQKRLWN